jgi:hypothetical protein
MTSTEARNWLVTASLTLTAGSFVFFLVAPALAYPLTFAQALRIVEIIVPVFMGYLGSAALYLFQGRVAVQLVGDPGLIRLMIRGPIIAFAVIRIGLLAAFGISNRGSAPMGAGMSVDVLAASTTAALGILTVTTNLAIARLFGGSDDSTKSNPRTSHRSRIDGHD